MADDSEWIDHDGGRCPCTMAIVDVKLRSGTKKFGFRAFRLPDNWTHDGGDRDIIAYRVVQS